MLEIQRIFYDKIRLSLCIFCSKIGIGSLSITLINHLLTITLGCYFLSRGEYIFGLLGLFILFINVILDYLDGDIARWSNSCSLMAAWWDSGFDVVIQNIVMGSLAIGCYKNGLDVFWIVLFFIGNSASNFVSFNFNQKFGFDSDKGNELFRKIMKRKSRMVNKIISGMIDPTDNIINLSFYTFRYWILIGLVFNIMPLLFIIITIITNIRWFIMFNIYALYLGGYDKLFVMKALSALDDEKEDFYNLRKRI